MTPVLSVGYYKLTVHLYLKVTLAYKLHSYDMEHNPNIFYGDEAIIQAYNKALKNNKQEEV